ncbi:MAG: class I SAM-dependent methyltransferase [Woeseiaceae bacterium]
MDEVSVEEFWQHHPCGDMQVGGLDNFRRDYEAFFNEYDKYRYNKEGHILDCLDQIEFADKQTLEIGLGQGADSEQIIRRGAKWSGIDLTAESVERVGVRLELKELPYQGLTQGSALEMPFEDNSFDIVFSHGVLHHIPEIGLAQSEISRVLRPDGMLVAMLYAKNSLNYWFSISIVRRLGLIACYLAPGFSSDEMVHQHVANAREAGLFQYLRMKNFIHRNTDGPLNPYSKVYDVRAVKEDFGKFDIVRCHKEFMHAPPLPAKKLPFAKSMGWHLWVEMVPKGAG